MMIQTQPQFDFFGLAPTQEVKKEPLPIVMSRQIEKVEPVMKDIVKSAPALIIIVSLFCIVFMGNSSKPVDVQAHIHAPTEIDYKIDSAMNQDAKPVAMKQFMSGKIGK